MIKAKIRKTADLDNYVWTVSHYDMRGVRRFISWANAIEYANTLVYGFYIDSLPPVGSKKFQERDYSHIQGSYQDPAVREAIRESLREDK